MMLSYDLRLEMLQPEHQPFGANLPDMVRHCLKKQTISIPSLAPKSDLLFQIHSELRSDIYHMLAHKLLKTVLCIYTVLYSLYSS